MTADKQPLVIIGAGEFAGIAYEYFTHDSAYEVVAFSVEASHLQQREFNGLPVVPFEEVERYYPPEAHSAFVAVTQTRLNRVRARLYAEAREKGYTLASYVSSRAFVWRNVVLGDNCFVFEANVLQHHVAIGSNVILWSGNHLGHRAVVGDHCFFASHAVVAGYSRIGPRCLVGVNCTIAEHITVAPDCVIGAGAVVLKDTEPGLVYRGNPAVAAGVTSFMMFGVEPEEP